MPGSRGGMRRCAAVIAATAVLLICGSPARADDVRPAEWPLDSQHLQADEVWKFSRGAGVTVAVIDSGVAAGHPDLAGQVLAGTSLLGDGGDGRTDTSGDSHGTAIAGIIAGTGGPQAAGMTGLAPDAKILPVRVSAGGQVTPSTLAQGIVWAADHGAQVVNISMGSVTPDPLLRQAVSYALQKDVVLVASAGNQGDSGNPAMYPAAFPGVVSVSGVDREGKFWSPSESGHGITVAAPASDIYSANDQGQYVHADGTSYAAAYVSAAAALIRSQHPQLTAGQVIRRIINSAAQHHRQPDTKLGYGRLNPLAALNSSSVDVAVENPLLHQEAAKPGNGSSVTVIVVTAFGSTVTLGAVLFLLTRRRRPAAAPVAAVSKGKPSARSRKGARR